MVYKGTAASLDPLIFFFLHDFFKRCKPLVCCSFKVKVETLVAVGVCMFSIYLFILMTVACFEIINTEHASILVKDLHKHLYKLTR